MLQVTANLDDEQTKAILKQAILEMLQEGNEILFEVISEVLADIAFTRTIEEGESSRIVDREEVFAILESRN